VALFVGDWAISQLCLFWVEPMVGGIIAGFLYRSLIADEEDS
jgi:aquaporin Z